jgi:hypothetical protein
MTRDSSAARDIEYGDDGGGGGDDDDDDDV